MSAPMIPTPVWALLTSATKAIGGDLDVWLQPAFVALIEAPRIDAAPPCAAVLVLATGHVVHVRESVAQVMDAFTRAAGGANV